MVVSATRVEAALTLLDWKRRIFELYEDVRATEPRTGWNRWREVREELFRSHPQSPLAEAARDDQTRPDYIPYDEEWRVLADVVPAVPETIAIGASGGETIAFERFALASFEAAGEDLTLDLYWLEGYGGGLFLPFADGTTGSETYAAGRYLLDTVKGADLGAVGDRLVLDFNFAYNPSCAYDPHWVCPLAPAANRLPVAVRAGELAPASP